MIMQSAVSLQLPVTLGASRAYRHVTVDSAPPFPEGRFPVPAQFAAQYRDTVNRGYEALSERRVVIAGLARNIRDTVELTINRIERLGQVCGDYRVVIFENDSRDGTDRLLGEWSKRNSRVSVLSEKRQDPINLPTRCLGRAQRMAFYRSQYHAHIAEHWPDFDNVVVVDTDLPGGWDPNGIAHTFGCPDWDFVGANGLIYRRIAWNPNEAFQYDAWAFRPAGSYEPLTTGAVNKMLWERGTPLVPVASCFGGLGIYRTEALLAGVYSGEDCEHVMLHRSMREAGYDRLFLNPSLVTLYGRKRRKMDAAVSFCQQVIGLAGVVGPTWF